MGQETPPSAGPSAGPSALYTQHSTLRNHVRRYLFLRPTYLPSLHHGLHQIHCGDTPGRHKLRNVCSLRRSIEVEPSHGPTPLITEGTLANRAAACTYEPASSAEPWRIYIYRTPQSDGFAALMGLASTVIAAASTASHRWSVGAWSIGEAMVYDSVTS